MAQMDNFLPFQRRPRERFRSIEEVAIRLSYGGLNIFEGKVLDGVSYGAQIREGIDGKRAEIRLRMHTGRQLLLLLLTLIQGCEGLLALIGRVEEILPIGAHLIWKHRIFVGDRVTERHLFIPEIAFLLLLLLLLLLRTRLLWRSGGSSTSYRYAPRVGSVIDGEAEPLPVFRGFVLGDSEEKGGGVCGHGLRKNKAKTMSKLLYCSMGGKTPYLH